MEKINDYVGKRIGILKIGTKIKGSKYNVTCDCGVKTTKFVTNLLKSQASGNTPSCGCKKGENIGKKLLGLPSHKKINFTPEEVNDIVTQHLNLISLHKIAEQYGCSQPVIRNVIKSKGYSPQCRRSDLDETFFDVIDSEVKAYWLGYLAADGTIRVRDKKIDENGKTKTRGNAIHLKLSITDEEHLKKFRDVICPNSVLKYATSIVMTKKGNESISHNVILNLYSNYLVSQIIDKGVGPRKTFTIGKPNIDEKYMRHYIRGLFDGDGSLSITDNKRITYVIATASENMANFLMELFDSLGIMMRRYGINCVINRKEDTMKFYHYIYDDATIWLERKKDKTVDVLKRIEEIDNWEKKYGIRYTENNKWSDEDLDILIESRKLGIPASLIVGKLNGEYTPKQVDSKIWRLTRAGAFEKDKI